MVVFAFFLIVLHFSAYSMRCLMSPFPAISRRLVIRARIGDNILHLCALIIVLASLDALCWIISVMVSLIVLVVSRINFSIQFGIRSPLILFVWYLLLVVSLIYRHYIVVPFPVYEKTYTCLAVVCLRMI